MPPRADLPVGDPRPQRSAPLAADRARPGVRARRQPARRPADPASRPSPSSCCAAASSPRSAARAGWRTWSRRPRSGRLGRSCRWWPSYSASQAPSQAPSRIATAARRTVDVPGTEPGTRPGVGGPGAPYGQSLSVRSCARRHAGHDGAVGHVADDHGAGADQAAAAHMHAVGEGRADADERAVADRHPARQVRARADRHVVAQHAVVADGCADVDQHVATDPRPAVDHAAGSDLRRPRRVGVIGSDPRPLGDQHVPAGARPARRRTAGAARRTRPR